MLVLHSWHHPAAARSLCGFGNSVRLLLDKLPGHTTQIFHLPLYSWTEESRKSCSSQVPPGDVIKCYAVESPNTSRDSFIPPSDQRTQFRIRLKVPSQEPKSPYSTPTDKNFSVLRTEKALF